MIHPFYLLLISFCLFGCNNTNSKNGIEKNNNIDIKDIDVSYDILSALLENKQPIPKEYLTDSIKGVLSEYSILNQSDNYVLIKANNAGTYVRDYYLLSFSKSTGKLISFLELGQETEGVQPSKINWESNDLFSTLNYRFELLEDEESGAYLQGNLIDSTIRYYEIDAIGFINHND